MKQASKRWTGFVLWLAVLTPAVTLAAAEPEDIIKYRKNAMKASGAHMAAAAAIVKGKVPFRDQLVVHARALEQINHDNTKLFPKDSDFGDTKALNAVWEKRADFEKAARTAAEKARAFARAAAGNDLKAAEAAHKELGEACSACHKKFRKKDE
ncbi:MAG: cytochrome c [Pseudomonadota bacterium]